MTEVLVGRRRAPAPVPIDVRAERSARRRQAVAVLRAYVALTKPRIVELLLVTTVPAMVLAARGLPPPGLVLATLVGGSLAAGSANALNCYLDRDIDAVMRRTVARPLPRHAVSARSALAFGVALGAVAVAIMGAFTGWLPALLTLAAILFYVLVYTLVLKRRTAQNIVWGGAAGCMPVLIGWSAVTGSLAWPPVVLFAVVFFWTPPHFWALAMRFRDDYARAGVPMLPVVATPTVVARRIVGYSWLTVATSLLLWPLATSWVYGAAAVAAGAWFLAAAHRLLALVGSADRRQVRFADRWQSRLADRWQSRLADRWQGRLADRWQGRLADRRQGMRGAEAQAVRLFHLSNSYLALLFVAVAVDALVR